jgi:hypothetical protein
MLALRVITFSYCFCFFFFSNVLLLGHFINYLFYCCSHHYESINKMIKFTIFISLSFWNN